MLIAAHPAPFDVIQPRSGAQDLSDADFRPPEGAVTIERSRAVRSAVAQHAGAGQHGGPFAGGTAKNGF